MFAIQKDHVELKNTIEALYSRLKEMKIDMEAPKFSMMSPHNMMHPQIRQFDQDSQDDDFYMDDDLRNRAMIPPEPEIIIKTNDKSVVQERLGSMYADDPSMVLYELTYEDLEEMVKEFLETDEKLDDSSTLIIDCSKEQHQVFLESLTSKTLPKLSSISLQNMNSGQEVVAKFLYVSLQNGVDTLILNEYCTSKIFLDYYIMCLQFLIMNRKIESTLIIRDVEISAEAFNILVNVAASYPISLETGWINIHEFEKLEIEVPEQDQRLLNLEVSYSSLGDTGE